MEYNSLFENFQKLFPDDTSTMAKIANESSVDSSDGMHVQFGMVVVPFILELVKENNSQKLKIAFDYFEQMETSADPKICEIVEFTVLEDLVSQNQDILDSCKVYMGPETLAGCQAIEQYTM